jgi:hypothetical protein
MMSCLAVRLQRRTRPIDERITHEHVYPRKDFVDAIREQWRCETKEQLLQRFDDFAIGCVVLECEHRQLGEPNQENPWQRYAGVVTLVRPSNWIGREPWGQMHRRRARLAGVLEAR